MISRDGVLFLMVKNKPIKIKAIKPNPIYSSIVFSCVNVCLTSNGTAEDLLQINLTITEDMSFYFSNYKTGI